MDRPGSTCRTAHGRAADHVTVGLPSRPVAPVTGDRTCSTWGEGDEGTPVAVVCGAGRWVTADHGPGAAAALRPLAEDMFR